MKILFPLDAFYPSQIGGPCNSLFWHTRELHKHKILTSVVTTSLGIKKGEVMYNAPIEDTYSKIFYDKKNSISFRLLRVGFSEMRDSDIVHLNSLFSPFSIFCFIFLKVFCHKKPLVLSVRGELNSNALKFSIWKKRPVLFVYKLLRRNIIFHATSNQERVDIQSIFKRANVFEIPNLINPSERLDIIDNRKQILYVGRIHPIKALHKVIEGLSLSKSFMNSDSKFVIIGTYEDRHRGYYDELLALIYVKEMKDKVEFKGHLKGIQKERAYAKSYFTLLLSESENFGNVVLESLNQGTPVLASFGTPWSILEESQCGFHISNEPREIALNIDKILSLSHEKYATYRINARALIDSKFNISSQIEQWIFKYNLINNA